jgi:hypothetical protein
MCAQKDSSDAPRDLANLPRAQLIRAGFEALSNQKSSNAVSYFGAAIRKAKRVQLYDVEAEFYKFVTLYLDGDYPESVNRLLECLDGVKYCADSAQTQGIKLPLEAAIEKLERCLIQAMVMRKDSFWSLTGHFWQMQYGEYYLAKKPCSLLGAIARTWMAFSLRMNVGYDMLKVEFQPFTSFLQTQLDAAKDMINEDAPEEGSSNIRRAETDPVTADREREKNMEMTYAEFLRKVREDTIIKSTEEEIDMLHEICRTTKNVSNLAEICRIIDTLGPNSKKTYLTALGYNEVLKSRETRLPDPDAERLHQEVLEYLQLLDAYVE